MRKSNWLAAIGFAVLAVPITLNAQMGDDARWRVDAVSGVQLFAESSALETGATLGVETFYSITPNFSIGPAADFVRSRTDGSFFIAVMDFGSAFRVYEVGQNVSALQGTANARFDLMPDGQFNPYVMAGGGVYRLYLGAQANDAAVRITNMMAQVGAGFTYALTETSGIRLDVRDVIYTDWDRDDLNPIRIAQRNLQEDGSFRVPGAERASTPDKQDTIHNIRVSLGFTYVPGSNR